MSRRDELLAAATDHVRDHGLAGLSLRSLAEALGTSHRMLLYHFGTKEALLTEVVREVEARTRRELGPAGRTAPAPGSEATADALRAVWRHVSRPSLAGTERVFFELYGAALNGHPGTEALLPAAVHDWVAPIAAAAEAAGMGPEEAEAEARLHLAVVRGLLLDLLATGDRKATTAAFEAHVAGTLARRRA